MRRVLLTVGALVAVLVTGCADRADPAPREAAARPEALTWQQELRVADAQQRLTRQCMRRHGFTYWEDLGLTLRESRPVRYVQDDVAWARTYGYGSRIEAESARVRERNPNGTYRQGLSPARRAAFDAALDGGDSARLLTAALPGGGTMRKRIGGCSEEAERTLYGDPAAWFRASKTATNLTSLYGERLMKDRRLKAAIRAWARCMRAAQQPYADPAAARDAVRTGTGLPGGAGSDEAFAAERETAVADAACARRSSLRAVATARETYYQDRLRDRFGEDLDTYRRLGQRAYDRAVHIVPERN
ncbi:entry exclusion lipoprotein TrbK [Streptomyces sp. MMBL 11-3]|uniref:entry exclusion lipoprotein TrbK n=1 Tax=Streptomyces sp. MMBL 11-3 TaxID=3382639 RepID=UPI0039B4C7D7